MGCIKLWSCVAAFLLIVNYASATIAYGGCPPANKVYNDKPSCFSDADCQKWGKICCPNQHNTKSCVNRAPWLSSMKNDNKYNGGGSGVDCAGVKCKSYEVCKPHPISKRLQCQPR